VLAKARSVRASRGARATRSKPGRPDRSPFRRSDDVGDQRASTRSGSTLSRTRRGIADLVQQRLPSPPMAVVVPAADHLRPGCAPMNRDPSRQVSCARWRTSVGTLTVGRMSRTSISVFISLIALAAPGLAPRRTYDVYQRTASGSRRTSGATRPSQSLVAADAQSSSSRRRRRWRSSRSPRESGARIYGRCHEDQRNSSLRVRGGEERRHRPPEMPSTTARSTRRRSSRHGRRPCASPPGGFRRDRRRGGAAFVKEDESSYDASRR
jgi:hypothetical protein